MRHQTNHEELSHIEPEWDRLLAAYREACSPPAPGTGFMPRLWEKIESRRLVPFYFRRLARNFITAAAAICMVLAVLLVAPSSPPPVFSMTSYVEMLAADTTPEQVAYAEISHADSEGEEAIQ